jgi:hypothetical protein
MEHEKQLVNRELAQEMKELGFDAPSVYRYVEGRNGKIVLAKSNRKPYKEGHRKTIARAYSVAELGEMLKNVDHPVPYWCSQAGVKSWCSFKNGEAYEIYEQNEANARAKCLIYLRKNNLI